MSDKDSIPSTEVFALVDQTWKGIFDKPWVYRYGKQEYPLRFKRVEYTLGNDRIVKWHAMDEEGISYPTLHGFLRQITGKKDAQATLEQCWTVMQNTDYNLSSFLIQAKKVKEKTKGGSGKSKDAKQEPGQSDQGPDKKKSASKTKSDTGKPSETTTAAKTKTQSKPTKKTEVASKEKVEKASVLRGSEYKHTNGKSDSAAPADSVSGLGIELERVRNSLQEDKEALRREMEETLADIKKLDAVHQKVLERWRNVCDNMIRLGESYRAYIKNVDQEVAAAEARIGTDVVNNKPASEPEPTHESEDRESFVPIPENIRKLSKGEPTLKRKHPSMTAEGKGGMFVVASREMVDEMSRKKTKTCNVEEPEESEVYVGSASTARPQRKKKNSVSGLFGSKTTTKDIQLRPLHGEEELPEDSASDDSDFASPDDADDKDKSEEESEESGGEENQMAVELENHIRQSQTKERGTRTDNVKKPQKTQKTQTQKNKQVPAAVKNVESRPDLDSKKRKQPVEPLQSTPTKSKSDVVPKQPAAKKVRIDNKPQTPAKASAPKTPENLKPMIELEMLAKSAREVADHAGVKELKETGDKLLKSIQKEKQEILKEAEVGSKVEPKTASGPIIEKSKEPTVSLKSKNACSDDDDEEDDEEDDPNFALNL